jgi:hypothetical protein
MEIQITAGIRAQAISGLDWFCLCALVGKPAGYLYIPWAGGTGPREENIYLVFRGVYQFIFPAGDGCFCVVVVVL